MSRISRITKFFTSPLTTSELETARASNGKRMAEYLPAVTAVVDGMQALVLNPSAVDALRQLRRCLSLMVVSARTSTALDYRLMVRQYIGGNCERKAIIAVAVDAVMEAMEASVRLREKEEATQREYNVQVDQMVSELIRDMFSASMAQPSSTSQGPWEN